MKSRLLSGKVKKLTGTRLDGSRYEYLDVSQAEPDLGLPAVDGSVLISLTTGTRIWSNALVINTLTSAVAIGGDLDVGGIIRANTLSITTTSYIANAQILTTATVNDFITVIPNQIYENTSSVRIIDNFESGVEPQILITVAAIDTVVYYSTLTEFLERPVVVQGRGLSDFSGIPNNALQVYGGIGAQQLYISGTAYLGGAEILTTQTGVSSELGSLIASLATVLTTTTNSTSTQTGALVVKGGIGVGKDVYIGGTLVFPDNGRIITNQIEVKSTGSNTSSNTGVLLINGGIVSITTTTSSTGSTNGALTVVGGVGIGGDLNVANTATFGSIGGIVNIVSTASSTSSTTGALRVAGGVGIGGDLYVGGNITANQLTIEYTTITTTVIQTDDIIVTVNTSSAISTDTGALRIAGGAGIGGDLWVGGRVYSQDAEVITTSSVNQYANQTVIYAGTDTAISDNSGTNITIWNTSTLESVTGRGNSTTNAISILNETVAGSTDTGALTVVGGVGIGGDLYVGGALYQNGLEVITTASVNDFANQTTITAGTDTAVSTSTGNITIWNTSTLESVTDRGNSTTNVIRILNTAESITSNTGALIVSGGLYVAKDTRIDGSLYLKGSIVLTSATLNAYVAGTDIRAGTDTAVSSEISTGTNIFYIWNTSTFQTVTDRGNSTTNAISILNTSNSALNVAGGVTVGSTLNIASTLTFKEGSTLDETPAGATTVTLDQLDDITNWAGTLVFTREDATTYTALPDGPQLAFNSPDWVLQYDSTVWFSSTDLVTWVAGPYAGTNPPVGTLSTGSTNLTVNGNTWTFGTDGTLTAPGNIVVRSTSSSTSTDTGALTVVGGVGIGENLFVKGIISAEGGFQGLDAKRIFETTSSVAVSDTGTIGKVTVTIANNTNTVFSENKVKFFTPIEFANSGTIADTTSSLVLTPPGALAGQGLVIRPTAGGGLQTSDTFIPGSSVTIDFFDNGSWLSSGGAPDGEGGTESNTWTYTITGISQADLGSPLTGSFLAENWGIPSIGHNVITFNIPAESEGTGFVITLDKIITDPPYSQINLIPLDGNGRNSLTVGSVLSNPEISHLHLTSADPTTVDLYLGDDDQYVKIVKNAGGVIVGTNSSTNRWVFDPSGNLTAPGDIYVQSTASSTSTTSGALTVAGGAGFTGDVYANAFFANTTSYIANAEIITTSTVAKNQFAFANTSSSTSTDTGALTVVGGVGIGGDLYIGGDIYTKDQKVITTATVNQFANQTSITAGTDTAISTSTGNIVIWNTSTLQSVSDRGNSTTNALLVLNTTSAVSTDTGALTVVGGVGVGGELYVGGKIYSETAEVLTTATVNDFANQTSITAGTDTAVSALSGSITVWNTSTLESVTGRGNSTTKGITIIGDFGFNGTTSTFNSTLLFDNSYNDIARGPNKIKLYDDGSWISGIGVSYKSVDIYSGKDTNFYQGAGPDTNNVGYLTLSISSSSVVINATSATVSTTTGALVVSGGVGIGGDLWVGGKLYANNLEVVTTATVDQALNQTLQTITDKGFTTTNQINVLNTSNAISITTAAFVVSGGASIGLDLRVGGRLFANNLEVVTTATVDQALNQTLQTITDKGFTTTNQINILSTLSSTATVTENALYVAGGVGIGKSLYVTGKTFFQDDVVFAGQSTYVYTTNTYYTDNLIELHVPGILNEEWTVNDGKDIGLRFHYYDTFTGDENAALVFSPTTGYLEWYKTGAEHPEYSQFTTATHGSFRVGEISIVNSTTAFSTDTGALRVVGGVGIGGDLWVGGNIYGVSTGSTFSGTANAANNIAGGAQYQIPFQSTTGTTNFDNKLRWISESSTLAIGTPNDPLGSLTVENNVTVAGILNVNGIRAIDTSSLYFNASGIYNTVTSTSSYYWSFGSDGRTNFPNYSFPAEDGPYGFALVTNGTGTVSWSPVLSYVGSIGYTGSSSGFTGSTGYWGSIGAIGYTGSIGYSGSEGVGYTGSSSGYIGSFGYTGSIGYTGSQGAGYTGSKGFIGSEGYTGSAGAGFAGSQGIVGYIGSTGLTGFVGSRGVDGTSVRILGSVTNTTDLPGWQYTYTGAIGDGYIVTASGHLWVWSGTMWVDAGLISGPQGDRGYVGSVGSGYVGSSAPGYVGSVGYQGSKGALDPWTKIVANYSASNNQRLIADTSAGQFTVALPDSPTIGSYLIITDGYSWSTIPLLVTSSIGTTIEGYGETLQLDITGITVEFIWSGATWQVTATLGVRGAGGYTGSMGAFAALGFTGSQAGLTTVQTDILPATSSTYALGAVNQGWTSVYSNFGYIGSNLYVGNETVDSLTVSKTLIISTSTMYLGGNTININSQGTLLLNNAQVGVSVAQATALSAAMSVVLGM